MPVYLDKDGNPITSAPKVYLDASGNPISQKPGVVPQEQLDQIQRLNANPTQFEKDRSAGNQEGGVASFANEIGNFVKSAPQMASQILDPSSAARSGLEAGANIVPDWKRRTEEGRGLPYKAAAVVAPIVGVNVNKMEQQADKGDTSGIVGTALADAVPLAVAEGARKFGPAVEKFAGSAVDKFQGAGVQKAVIPEASALPPKAISGAEDIFRAAAPTGKNAGFRENVMVAAPDLADVARKVKISEAKGGIINPDMRVRATVDALDSHLNEMYQNERAPQIQAHAEVPVKVGANPDSVRGLEYLENTAGTDEIRSLATKAIEGKQLTLAEADKLAISANEYLKSFERAPGDVKMQIQQTSPKVAGLKALDVELGGALNDTLKANGEVGLRDYERRFAAVSEVRNQLRDRMNAVELTRQNPVKTLRSYLGSPKEAIASASQAAVSDVNIGRKLQTAFQKLRESGITAQKKP